MIPLTFQIDLHALALKSSLHLLGVVLLCLKLFGRGLVRSDALLLQHFGSLMLLQRVCSLIFLVYSQLMYTESLELVVTCPSFCSLSLVGQL